MTPPPTTAAVDADARQQAAVLAAKLADCSEAEKERWGANRSDHTNLFDRVTELEKALAGLGGRIGVWAAVGACLATSVIGAVIVALVKRIMEGR